MANPLISLVAGAGFEPATSGCKINNIAIYSYGYAVVKGLCLMVSISKRNMWTQKMEKAGPFLTLPFKK